MISQREYLYQLVERLKNNQTIKEYEVSKGAQFTEIGLLALMQHYDLPTPLLDWTPDIDIALNFAFDSMKPGNDNDQISNYVSLYSINLFSNNELVLSSYQSILEDATNKLNGYIDSGEMDGVNMENGSLDRLFGIKDIHLDFFYIDYSKDAPYVKDIFGASLDLKNPNLDKQEGAFIVNCDKDQYLEFLWNRKTDPSQEVMLDEKLVELNKIDYHITTYENPYAVGILPKTKICCWNIRKNILEEWIKKGGYKEHYVEDDLSKSLKEVVLSEYHNWLLKGELCEKAW